MNPKLEERARNLIDEMFKACPPPEGEVNLIDSWKCMICDEERPDQFISVLSKPIPYGQYNIRYCNDRQACRDGAEKKELFKWMDFSKEDKDLDLTEKSKKLLTKAGYLG